MKKNIISFLFILLLSIVAVAFSACGDGSTESWTVTYTDGNGEIKTVSESFIEVSGDYIDDADGWLMTDSKTVVYGDLVAGNYAFWVVGADGYVDVIFSFAQ